MLADDDNDEDDDDELQMRQHYQTGDELGKLLQQEKTRTSVASFKRSPKLYIFWENKDMMVKTITQLYTPAWLKIIGSIDGSNKVNYIKI